MRTILALSAALAAAMAAAPPAGAGQFLPLETGNRWVYRARGLGDGLTTISVGVPSLIGGTVYHSLHGYTESRLLVRYTDAGDLVWLDEESGREMPLARFGSPETPYEITGAGCRLRAAVSGKPVPYDGPAGAGAALEIRYEPVQCADAGFDHDLYLENIGLVRRSVVTIAGPRIYELVEARVGKWSFAANPGAAARLTVEPAGGGYRAALRVSLPEGQTVKVRFPSSQTYDLVIRDGAGKIVYSWSAGKAFLQVYREEELAGERVYEIGVEATLPEGTYQVEAWLATAENPQFAASAALRVE